MTFPASDNYQFELNFKHGSMIWSNIQELAKANQRSAIPTELEPLEEPQPRWGHASAVAHNKMFILGGYQGNNSQQPVRPASVPPVAALNVQQATSF